MNLLTTHLVVSTGGSKADHLRQHRRVDEKAQPGTRVGVRERLFRTQRGGDDVAEHPVCLASDSLV